MATRKALRDHEKSLRRQKARRLKPGHTDRDAIGIALCRAILHSHEQHRKAKQATGST